MVIFVCSSLIFTKIRGNKTLLDSFIFIFILLYLILQLSETNVLCPFKSVLSSKRRIQERLFLMSRYLTHISLWYKVIIKKQSRCEKVKSNARKFRISRGCCYFLLSVKVWYSLLNNYFYFAHPPLETNATNIFTHDTVYKVLPACLQFPLPWKMNSRKFHTRLEDFWTVTAIQYGPMEQFFRNSQYT